ncbi:MAG: SusC/RagA family TonB-linked outer membrane protein [Bacteroidales bacterium]
MKKKLLWQLRFLPVFFFLLIPPSLFGAKQQEKISINLKNVKISEVFNEIEKKTSFKFFYKTSYVESLPPVTIEANDIPFIKVLEDIFKGTNLIFTIHEKQIIVQQKDSEHAKKAPFKVTGKVTFAQDGYPVQYANIYVKGSPKIGAVTDDNGVYNIENLPDNTVLIFSYIGYVTQEIPILKDGVLNIALAEDIAKLQEVFVTGYYTQKKESFTGSAVSVSGDELRRVGTQNILSNIQVFDPSFKLVVNNLAGSNPNVLPEFQVRGATAIGTTGSGTADLLDRRTLTSSNPNMPTFILDGYQVTVEKIFDLDINRVESVTLLKDAAATAIYGSRASNGVVVIKTKDPKEGKLMLSYNFETVLSTPDLSVYNLLNAQEKLEYEVLAGLYEPTVNIKEDDQIANYTKKREYLAAGVNTDWIAKPVRNSFGQKHSMYIEGGSKTIRYGADLRYQTSNGVMKGSDRNRIGIGMNLSYNLNDKLLFKNYLSVEKVNSNNSPYGSFATYVKQNPYYPIIDGNGLYIREMEIWQHQQRNGAVTTSSVLNPLYDATLSSFDKSEYSNITNQFSLEWNIFSGLRFRSSVSYSSVRSTSDAFTSPFDNDYYFYEAAEYNKRGSYIYTTGNTAYLDGQAVLTYNKGIKKHFVNFALGANIATSNSDNRGIRAIGFTNDRFSQLGFANSYQTGDSPISQIVKSRLFGSFSSINYSYANKYLLDLSARLDGSSKFGSDNKYAPFWSAGIGWNIHKEEFMENSLFSELKLRATTGFLGEVSFDPYMSKTIYEYYTDNWYSTGVGAGYLGYGNELLKWQRTQSSDLGLDFGILENRIWVSGRYYYKKTKDLLADINTAPSLGFKSYKSNLGELENQGFELNARFDLLKNNKDWRVNLTGNFSHNKNKILNISEALKAYNQELVNNDDNNYTRPIPQYVEGQSISMIYAVRSLGIDTQTGMEVYQKRDGSMTYVYNAADMVPIADRAPKAEGFIGANVSFRNFMLSANLYYKYGGYMFNQTLVDRVENADPRYNVDRRALNERWQKPGDQTFYKSVKSTAITRATSRFVQKDNEIGLTSVNLMYELPKELAKKIMMENLRFNLNMGETLKWSSVNIERGIDYPFSRTFTFSITAQF